MHLNVPLAKAYARELDKLSKQLRLPGAVMLDHLVRAPGVFQTDEQIARKRIFGRRWKRRSRKRCQRCPDARTGRGNLRRICIKRVTVMRKAVAQIQKHAPGVADVYRQQLVERIQNRGPRGAHHEDDRCEGNRLFADRSDISEELTRCRVTFSSLMIA